MTPDNGTPHPAKFLCNENKTVVIDKINCYDKFVKNAKDTKKEFHMHFPGLKIIYAQGTRRGSLLIELKKTNFF